MSYKKQQGIVIKNLQDQQNMRGGISLLSANRPTYNKNQAYSVINSANQPIRQVIPVVQYVQASPSAFIQQSIKQLPVETERVGSICSSYINKSPTRHSSQNNRRQQVFSVDESTSKNASFIQQSNSNSGMNTADVTQFISNINPNNNNLQQLHHELMVVSPQRVVISPLQQQQQYYSNQENQLTQITAENISFTSGNGQLSSARQNLRNPIRQSYNGQNNSNGTTTQHLRQIASAYSTPIRKREDHLSYDQVQQRINPTQTNKSQDIGAAENEKCKIFSEEFLEQRERDFKRRIENLELQKDLLTDQLQQKDDEISKEKQQHSQCLNNQAELENIIASISQEKLLNEQQFVSEIQQLKLTIQQLSESNLLLQQQMNQSQPKYIY